MLATMLCASCASSPDMSALLADQHAAMASANAGMDTMLQKQRLMQDVMKNPDIAGWHEQRQHIVLALGDRVFDRGFNRVFDSMTVALATLGCKVQNMERASGYITASSPALAPQQADGLRSDALREYAGAKGYPPGLLDKRAKQNTAAAKERRAFVIRGADDFADVFDVESTVGMMQQHGGGMTLSLVRQGENQTKVKLRFDQIYYPQQVQEYYRIVWAALDKQMFLDQALD